MRKVINKKRLAGRWVAAVMTQRVVRGFLARRRYMKMTTSLLQQQQLLLLLEAQLVDGGGGGGSSSTTVITAAAAVAMQTSSSSSVEDFTVEDYKHFEAIVHDELTKILATHKVTDQDIYLHLDVNVYKVR